MPAAGTAIVAGPGAASTTYATPVMVTQVGGPVVLHEPRPAQHDVVSDELAPDGQPLFRSQLSGIGETVPVEGLDRVQSGQPVRLLLQHPSGDARDAVRALKLGPYETGSSRSSAFS